MGGTLHLSKLWREKPPCLAPTVQVDWQGACVCLDEGVKLSHRKGSEVCVFLFSFNQVALFACVGACVCVCVWSHSGFLSPITALIHQLAVAMVFQPPPNQSHAAEHAQRWASQDNCASLMQWTKSIWWKWRFNNLTTKNENGQDFFWTNKEPVWFLVLIGSRENVLGGNHRPVTNVSNSFHLSGK